MERIRAVVFDLDGTLVDSLSDIAAAVNSTLSAHGRPGHALEAYRTMVGWGLRQLLVAASVSKPFQEEELEQAHREVVALYHDKPVAASTVYDGIRGLLTELSSVPLAVLSNKEEGVARRVVAALFPDTFETVLGSRPDRPGKPDPTALLSLVDAWGIEPSECALLGDSGVDIETAVRAGAVACGASWGFREADELTAAGARAVFSHPDDFARWLVPRLMIPNVPEEVS
jgi:phosphoglycolate phosphatase